MDSPFNKDIQFSKVFRQSNQSVQSADLKWSQLKNYELHEKILIKSSFNQTEKLIPNLILINIY